MLKQVTSRLTVIAQRRNRGYKELQECLELMGYAVGWCDGGIDNPEESDLDSPTILFLGRESAGPAAANLLLARHCRRPQLVVLEEYNQRLDSLIVNSGCEFVFWPCPRQELELRVRRMIPPTQPTGVVADEFATLNLIGGSPAFKRVLQLVRKYQGCLAPVLIQGDTGTGKERVARAIHYLGALRDGPFVPVNCGAIPDSLLANELFGHEQGAFTDAKSAQRGLVAEADGGTLFLDEVDSLSHRAQVALLRFLEDRVYRPLGAEAQCKSDVRLVAAAGASLPERVADGSFRQDLLFRLNILPIVMPPLRQRRGDVDLLAHHFLRLYGRRYGRPTVEIHPRALAWMDRYRWPGNVRELENSIHRALLTADGATILLEDIRTREGARVVVGDDPRLDLPNFRDRRFAQAKAEAVARFERRYLNWIMQESKGNVTVAARRAGKERRALGKLLKKHGIERHVFARGDPTADMGPDEPAPGRA